MELQSLNVDYGFNLQGLFRVRAKGHLEFNKAVAVKAHDVYVIQRSKIFSRSFVSAYRRLHQDTLRRLATLKKDAYSFDLFFNISAWNEILVNGLHPVMLDVMVDSANRAQRLVGEVGGTFTMYNQRARDWLRTKELKFADEVNQNTISQLRGQLEEGYELGETYSELAGRVSDVFSGTLREEGWRSMRVARTEINSVSNQGLLEGYQEAGVSRKRWLSAPTARPWHLEASGQEVRIDEPFIVNGEELMAPGDPSGSPENIINCRCVVQPVV